MNETRIDPITAIQRAYPQQPTKGEWKKEWGKIPFDQPAALFVFDTESCTNETPMMEGFERAERWGGLPMSLLVGYAEYRTHRGELHYEMEDARLFYPDDLPDYGLCIIQAYAEQRGLVAVNLTEFLKWMYLKAVKTQQQARAGEQVYIVGFNLPFDLSRIARYAQRSQRKSAPNAFSLRFWEYVDKKTGKVKSDRFKPNLIYQDMDDFAFLNWTQGSGRDEQGKHYPVYYQSNFFDCQTAMRALYDKKLGLDASLDFVSKKTGRTLTRKRKTETYGILSDDFLDYLVGDVISTGELAEELLREMSEHPVPNPCKIYSTASLAACYWRAMGIHESPPIEVDTSLNDTPTDVIKYSMAGYHAGRAEVMVRGVHVPVVYHDLLSAYPTGIVKSGLWEFIIAENIIAYDSTKEVRELVKHITLDVVLDMPTWRPFTHMVQVDPHDDVRLPVRASYDGTGRNIGLNDITSSKEPLWYPLYDIVASVLLTGKVPHIVRAIGFKPGAPKQGLKPVSVMGIRDIDPYHDDFYKAVVECRKNSELYEGISLEVAKAAQQVFKLLMNSSYGKLAEMNEKDTELELRTIHAATGDFDFYDDTLEVAGDFFCAPLAAFVTAAPHLMLALVERMVRDKGSQPVFCDTDSMTIVATPEGGMIELEGRGANGELIPQQIRALSWQEDADIVRAMDRLNPYDRSKVIEPILKFEDENYLDKHDPSTQRILTARPTAPKRYCLYDDKGEPVKVTVLGFGPILNPDPRASKRREVTGESYAEQLANDMYRAHWNGDLESVPYLDKPNVRQRTISKANTMDLFAHLNRGKPYDEQIKPANFYLESSVVPTRFGVRREVIFRPFERNPDKWLDEWWIVRSTGEPIYVYTPDIPDVDTGLALAMGGEIETLRDFITDYLKKPVIVFNGPDGEVCSELTAGVLSPRRLSIVDIQSTGKESKYYRQQDEKTELVAADYADEVIDFGRLPDLPESKLYAIREVNGQQVREEVQTTPTNEVRIPIAVSAPLNVIELNGKQAQDLWLDVLRDVPTKTLSRALGLTDKQVRNHKRSGLPPRPYREHYREMVIRYCEQQAGQKGLRAVWEYHQWCAVWVQLEFIPSDMEIIMRKLKVSRKTVWNYLAGNRAPSVKTIRRYLGALEDEYRTRYGRRKLYKPLGGRLINVTPPLKPGETKYPFLPLASTVLGKPALTGLSFWRYLLEQLYWYSTEGQQRIQSHQDAFVYLMRGEIELEEGQELAETLTDNGWEWQVTSPEAEEREAL